MTITKFDRMQMCTVDDLTAGDPCLRMAQWVWQPGDDDHPVYLCNLHAEPFEPRRCICGPDSTGENPDCRPDCPQHGADVSTDPALD